jgi:hypothetical protein
LRLAFDAYTHGRRQSKFNSYKAAQSAERLRTSAGARAARSFSTRSKAKGTYESHAGAFAKLKLAKQDHTHTIDKAEVDPPHVKLAFLMKLSGGRARGPAFSGRGAAHPHPERTA